MFYLFIKLPLVFIFFCKKRYCKYISFAIKHIILIYIQKSSDLWLFYILSTGVKPNNFIPLYRVCLAEEYKANLAKATSFS